MRTFQSHLMAGPLLVAGVFALGVAACGEEAPAPPSSVSSPGAQSSPEPQDAYEVWVVDQSDSDHEARMGGRLYIYRGVDLEGEDPAGPEPIEVVDLARTTAELCVRETGVNPVRPHMLLFDPEGERGILSFVGSGHVVVIDAARREPLDCFRATPGSGGAQQAHAAFPSHDGTYIVVANQNGKLLERLDIDPSSGTVSHSMDATLDLANGLTPSGALREDPVLRPDNAPICPVVDHDSRFVWVTLRGGGLLVVDPRSTPMEIVAEYDREVVRGNGCGGVQVGDALFLNSGGAPVNLQGQPHPHLSLYGFDVYRFPVDGYQTGSPPNTPEPTLLFTADGARDSHGMAAVAGGRFVWVMDRHAGVAEVISTETGEWVGTVPLAGPVSEVPAPDLVDVSPSGHHLFVALRGPTPLTGDPHNATGTTPGLGIIRVTGDGSEGRLEAVARISNVHDGVEMADAHALRVRRLP
jgi:DNA-binding beta-propeller fold protein YncE